jgi:hypothetical protein
MAAPPLVSPARRALWRVPLLALAMIGLLAALWAGVLRLPWALPAAALAPLHGPLMVSGFLGTVIGLERAVGLRSRWAYAGPLLTGLGVPLAVHGWPGAAALFAAGAAVLVALYGVVFGRQAMLFTAVMALGAAAWLVGNSLWLTGRLVPEAVPWWAAFLVLTIAGERLELTRLLPRSARAQVLFGAAVLLLLGGLVLGVLNAAAGGRLFGAGCLALALWLARYDVARRTVKQQGLPRFTAVCLLAGYAWLGVGGALMLGGGMPGAGFWYDAQWHALFLGFVFSMIFGHAPVIFPAVLLRPVAFAPRFYTHLALLHAGLLLRIGGDLLENALARRWGGLLNTAAILLFLASTALALARGTESRNGA